MLCKACNKTTNTQETEDCFENALDAIKLHYICKCNQNVLTNF